MRKIPSTTLIPWSASRLALLTFSAVSLAILSGCSSAPTQEPQPTVLKPKPTPLPAAISQISPKPSTEVLQLASEWLHSSKAVLESVTQK